MADRRRRILAQTIVGVSVLGLLALGVWLAARTSGREAAVPRASGTATAGPYPLTALVPDRAQVVLTTSWPELCGAPWSRRLDSLRALRADVRGTAGSREKPTAWLATTLLKVLRALGPDVAACASERTVLSGELVLAGELDVRPPWRRASPDWHGELLITRIAPELVAALSQHTLETTHGRPAPDVQLRYLGDGVLEIVLEEQPVEAASPDPMHPWGPPPPAPVTWYLFRRDDVVAFGGNEGTVREVAGIARSLAEAPARAAWFEGPPAAPDAGLSARVDVEELRNDLRDLLLGEGAPLALLRYWLPVTTMKTLELSVDARSPRALRAQATLTHEPGRLPERLQEVYAGEPADLSRVASYVPAGDTLALLTLRAPPAYAARALGEIRSAFRTLGRSRVRGKAGTLAGALGETWAFSLARRPAAGAASTNGPGARAHETLADSLAWALIVTLDEGVDARDLRADLQVLGGILGIPPGVAEYRGHAMGVAGSAGEGEEDWWRSAAWFVAEDHLVISNHRPYLERFVDAVVDPDGTRSLAQDPAWRETAAALPERAHLALYVDLEALLRVPVATDASGVPGGLLWDLRALWTPADPFRGWEEQAWRMKLEEQYRKATGSAPDMSAGKAIEEDVARHMEELRARRRSEEEGLRARLDACRGLRGLGVTVIAASRVLEIALHVGAE